eukprot:SAG11_NODE_5648_length_1496_cov_2.319971_2_plen_35_part_01
MAVCGPLEEGRNRPLGAGSMHGASGGGSGALLQPP